MQQFDYMEARTLRQASAMLERLGDEARLVAGSTDFLIRWRQGAWKPKYVIDIGRISSLKRVSYSPRNGLRLGALVTVRQLETHPVVRQRYQALAAAASVFAGVQVRNLATVGGNVCNASPAGDTLPALLAFDAQCRVAGHGGVRWVPLAEFFLGPGKTVIQQGEILTEVQLPPPLPHTGSLYIKHSPRGAMDIATVGVASVVSLQEEGRTFKEVRIALGAVAPTPVRARTAEELLRGRTITGQLVEEAAREAQRCATPIDDIRGTASHRKAMVGVLTQRTLEHAIEIARAGPPTFDRLRGLAAEAVL